ncbi:N-acetylneuraminate synthase family protein [Aestuariispira insulae]|uniref:N-acetylneuraminate synthase/N,N'-diacetyllegionaminate synthase n=1 Tax=Aestuariispira insulae TaxID=1461337 RepID=A0A3D9HSK6_9PROT|nr:N-acetylneuraminate synthase family protein [Aestuariispira insulae]RED52439.1 N-acetylneuraminate synthase/N,N'-diacetyllegionaminate synthase [Aestuariispira insulae]
MKLFGKELDREILLIAEIGVNHEGDLEAASRLLALAAKAGADAVKFQSYTPERFISTDDAERLERVRRFGLDQAAHERLAAEARALDVPFFSSAISEDWVPKLAELGEAIKIASGDITFEPVIRAAAGTGCKVILSTGTATVPEIDRAVHWVRDVVGEDKLADRLVLLHCVSAYPTPMEQANLLSIPYLMERYHPVTIGYSNHVKEREAAIAAVALGARVVEMHFTDRKEGRDFHDHSLSADPEDLAYLARVLPQVAAARGQYGKEVQACESGNVWAIRKGVSANRDLVAGTVIGADDIRYTRPATEFPSLEADKVIGATLAEDCREGAVLKRSMVHLDRKG